MIKEFIKASDPEAYIDRVKMRSPNPTHLWKECPKCNSYGKRNMQLNAYKLPAGMEDTAENRATYVHFTSVCGHCNGRGYVDVSINCPGHEWIHEKNLGIYYNRYRCSICNTTQDIDSSEQQ